MNRKAGTLLAISSLSSNHGIGDLGENAYEFIDILSKMKMSIWQILPINPVGFGNSPYQPYSSFAGEELYISLDLLQKEGLIKSELITFNKSSKKVEYDKVREFKQKYLREAYNNFKINIDYQTFIEENKWVENYSIFIAFKKANNFKCWNEWPIEMQNYPSHKSVDLSKYSDEINFQKFIQYIFYKQWFNLRAYANENGIEIMGDIPIYVGIDSQDVWENKQIFLLDQENKPTYVAGVPPDYFSKTGQRWGNPLYDWNELIKTNFAFWIERLRQNNTLFDIIRIDHFRAFDTYYKIPSSCETAIEGEWVEAPGYKLFDEIYKQIPDINIVVEDLGDLRNEVHLLRDHYHLKGMKIVQFSIDPNENNNNFVDKENMIIYTGTHDNQTLLGFINTLDSETKIKLEKQFNTKDLFTRVMNLTFNSPASICIIPIQDILYQDDSSRMNTPGSVGSPNWEYKLDNFNLLYARVNSIKNIVNNSLRNNVNL